MKKIKIELPSNRKFGFLFSIVFALISLTLFSFNSLFLYKLFLILSLLMLLISLTYPNLLKPFNYLWMLFGTLTGKEIRFSNNDLENFKNHRDKAMDLFNEAYRFLQNKVDNKHQVLNIFRKLIYFSKILGLIFFLMFSPISIISKLFGRDELNLRSKNEESLWKNREDSKIEPQSFNNQF